ncbi:nucleotidyltransferase domain-containing protein [Clostridium sp.]|uniref:nucleotidyltransferase domain-containing protein n=1 Tax=Clostridium sp. TaxID=1506 RepID=UPI002FCC7AE6
MDITTNLKDMIRDFSELDEVLGILLAGSHATKTNDENSDYDIYIYLENEISVEKRKEITSKYCSYMESNNTFWETEDDGILKDSNIPVEIIYREIKWIEDSLNRTLVKCEADIGYTTCFWSNFINSIILYDKNGCLNELQQKYKIKYPQKLKENIIKKNYPLLKLQMPAYYYQIEKALKRDDFISVNHRVAALLASYFDIIFAINDMAHPGEKKIIKIIKDNRLKVPNNMDKNINNILSYSAKGNLSILSEMDMLIENLDMMLKDNGLYLF